jgi:hypothetical protein
VVGIRDGANATCSGTVIHPHAVLTAAHCIVGEQLEVVEGARSDDPSVEGNPVVARLAHPDFRYFPLTDDVAVLVTARPLGAAPLELGPAPRIGDAVVLAGFGRTSPDGADGVLHVGTATVNEAGTERMAFEAAPSLGCTGDSGGPVLDASRARIVGVISSGDAECSTRTSASILDAYRAFLDDVILAVDASVEVGERCLRDGSCPDASACVPLGERGGYCDGACARSSDCPPGTRCDTGRCVPKIAPGSLGQACTTSVDCADGTCLADESVCGLDCMSEGDVRCRTLGGVCVAEEGAWVCRPAPSTGGCAVHATPSGPVTSLALWTGALLVESRRRRRLGKTFEAGRPHALVSRSRP